MVSPFWALRLALLLLAGARVASGGDSVDLGTIADVMAAREEATLPFRLSYRVVETFRGAPWPPGCIAGDLARARDKSVLRISMILTRPDAPRNKGARVRVLWKWDGVREYHITQKGTDGDIWHGTVSTVRAWKVVCSPEDFSLSDGRTWYSDFLRRPSARVLEGENASHGLLRVIADRYFPCTTVLEAPIELWLDPKKGYLPRKVIFYRRVSEPPRASARGVLAIDNRVFEPYVWRAVLEDTPCGKGWLASRATERTGESRREMVLDQSRLRHGRAVTPLDFEAPETVDAKILDETAPGPSVRSFTVTDKRLAQIIDRVRADRSSLRVERPLPSSPRPWLTWLLAGLGVALGTASVFIGNLRIHRSWKRGLLSLVLLLAASTGSVAGDDDFPSGQASVRLQALRRCGSNCVFVALRHFGKDVTLRAVQDAIESASRTEVTDAQTLAAMRKALEDNGLHTRPIRASIETIAKLDYPALVFLPPRRSGVGHFVYAYRDDRGHGRIVDPPQLPQDLTTAPPDERFVSLLISSAPIREERVGVRDVLLLIGVFASGFCVGRFTAAATLRRSPRRGAAPPCG